MYKIEINILEVVAGPACMCVYICKIWDSNRIWCIWAATFFHASHEPHGEEESKENVSSTDEIAVSNPILNELHWNGCEWGGQDERKIGALCIVEPSRGVFGLLCEVALTALGIKEQSIVHGPNTGDYTKYAPLYLRLFHLVNQ